MRSKSSSLFLAALAAALCVLSAPEAAAENCYYGTRYYYTPSYSAPAYQQSYYVAPTYHQAPTYTAPAYQAPAYPYPVKAYYNPDYYWSTQDYYRDKLLVDAMAGRVAQMQQAGNTGGQFEVQNGKILLTKEQLAQLLQDARGGQTQQGIVPQQQQQQPKQGASSGWYSGPGSGAPSDPKLNAIVQASCINCHNGANPARMNLSELDRLSADARALMWANVNDNQMPKNASPLGDEAEKAFRANWKAALAVSKR